MEQGITILVVIAHPDDAEVHCAGTIAKYIRQQQANVAYVVCTNGDKGNRDSSISPYQLAEAREREQQQAAAILGVQRTIFLRQPDGEIVYDKALRNDLALLIRSIRPSLIFTHDPWQAHQLHADHRVVGLATVDAVTAARDTLYLPAQTAVGLLAHKVSEIFFFRSDATNYYEDISATIEVKLEALRQHESQMQPWPEWQERILRRAAAAGQEIGVDYAEPFKRFVVERSQRSGVN